MAFKLTELFVEISAQESPFRASIAALKGAAGGMASTIGGMVSGAFTGAVGAVEKLGSISKSVGATIGKSMTGAIDPVKNLGAAAAGLGLKLSGAWSAALGPIGIAYTAISGLFGMLDEGNEDVEALSEYWSDAMKPIVQVFAETLHTVKEWIKGVKESAIASESVQAVIRTFVEYAKAGFDNIKTAIDQGVAAFYIMKTAADDALPAINAYLVDTYNAIIQTFGGSSISLVSAWGAAVKEWVLDKVELVGIFVRNWPDFFQIAYLQIVENLANIAAYIMTIPANAKIVGEYVANNWVKLFIDAGNAIGTAFYNLGKNLRDIWQAFLDFLKTGKFDVDFTKLLKGFVATADKLPELVKPALTSYADEIKVITDRIAARVFEAHAAREKAATTPGAEGPSGFKSEMYSLTGFAEKLRQSILSGPKDDKEERRTKAAEKTAENTGKIATEIAKPRPARAS